MNAPTGGVTPLTRNGHRTATGSQTGKRASTARTFTLNPQPSTPLEPAATIRTMIVCLPDSLPPQALQGCRLDRHFGVSGTLTARFWATATLHRWQRNQLIDLRTGKPRLCAGGPVRLLDLAGMRSAAGVGAGIRHQIWQQAVAGTRPAQPWHHIHTRHTADPDRYPHEQAVADFHHQPRVNAMRLHNAATDAPAQLPLQELEMFQAGPVAYQHYRATTAICADALLTPTGHQLTPVGDALTHRVTYLQQASHYLDTLDPNQRLLALTL